jgi:hypothetical protein
MGKPTSNYLEKCTAQYCTLANVPEQIVPCFRGEVADSNSTATGRFPELQLEVSLQRAFSISNRRVNKNSMPG